MAHERKACASSSIPDCDGRPREVQYPLYESAAIVTVAVVAVEMSLRDRDNIGILIGVEAPLLGTLHAARINTEGSLALPLEIQHEQWFLADFISGRVDDISYTYGQSCAIRGKKAVFLPLYGAAVCPVVCNFLAACKWRHIRHVNDLVLEDH